MFPFAFVAWLADAFVGFWCVLANCIDVTVIRSFCALVNIWKHRTNPKGTDEKGDLRDRKPSRTDIPLEEAVCLPAFRMSSWKWEHLKVK